MQVKRVKITTHQGNVLKYLAVPYASVYTTLLVHKDEIPLKLNWWNTSNDTNLSRAYKEELSDILGVKDLTEHKSWVSTIRLSEICSYNSKVIKSIVSDEKKE